mmetsp:Transcript_15951/g.13926  ORF Transcript_15951/g.13926 Transcript_15951/m.13926 type:complete len:324 (+) Transcript_15951:415-1386(+)
MKKVYKYFEKDSDEIAVKLFEVFIGCLRNSERATKEDVELYLRSHKSIITSMNKLDEAHVSREFAKKYADTLKGIKEPIKEKENSFLIPFYVWLDNVVRVILYTVSERRILEEIEKLEEQIFEHKHQTDRNMIVLDHVGYNPHQTEHFENIITFWDDHKDDISDHMETHEDKLENWDNSHVQEIIKKQKRHGEEEKNMNINRIYPVQGKKIEEEEEKEKSTKKEVKTKKPVKGKAKGKAKTKTEETKADEPNSSNGSENSDASDASDASESGDDQEGSDEDSSGDDAGQSDEEDSKVTDSKVTDSKVTDSKVTDSKVSESRDA